MAATLSDGDTWDGSDDGHPWTVNGAGITWDVFAYEWKAERYDAVTADDWVDESAALQSVSITHGVAGWWQGVLSGTAVLTFANDAPVDVTVTADAYLAKQWWRVSVATPSGDHVMFFGRSTDVDRHMSPTRYGRLLVTVSDFVGLNAQHKFFLFGTVDQETTTAASLLAGYGAVLDAPGVPPLSTYLSELPIGVGDGIGDVDLSEDWEGNWLAELNRVVNSELGLFYFNPQRQKWVFLLADWWVPDDVNVVDSFVGSDLVISDMYDAGRSCLAFRVSPESVSERVRDRDKIRDWTLTGPSGESTGTGAASGPPFGSLSTFLVSNAIQDDIADALAAGTAEDHDNAQASTWRIAAAAEVSYDNMEFAALVEVADLLRIGRDPGPGPNQGDPSAFNDQHDPAYVFQIRHRWTPAAGWTVQLVTDGHRLSLAAAV